MTGDRPDILSAKLEKLAAIMADANAGKDGAANPDDWRAAQQAAADEVMGAKGSVAEVEAIELPSERV